MIRNPTPARNVNPMYIRNFPKLFIFRDAQAMTIVMLEVISTTVLTVASGTFRMALPWGHSGALTRRRM
jgi:hypothetical protein